MTLLDCRTFLAGLAAAAGPPGARAQDGTIADAGPT